MCVGGFMFYMFIQEQVIKLLVDNQAVISYEILNFYCNPNWEIEFKHITEEVMTSGRTQQMYKF